MQYTKKDQDLDRLIEVYNNKYDSSIPMLNIMIQNILGFSIAMFIQLNRDKIHNIQESAMAYLDYFIWCLAIDNIVLRIKKRNFNKDKEEALGRIRNIAFNLKKIGFDVEENDVLHSIKERINSNIDYYYIIDTYNNIIPVSKKIERKGLFNKEITWGEGIDEYDHVSLRTIASIVTGKDGFKETIMGKAIPNKNNYVDVNKVYELAYKQDEEVEIIAFYKKNDEIIILYTIGDIEKKNTIEKYIKIGLLLQSKDYKICDDVNSILKKSLQNKTV